MKIDFAECKQDNASGFIQPNEPPLKVGLNVQKNRRTWSAIFRINRYAWMFLLIGWLQGMDAEEAAGIGSPGKRQLIRFDNPLPPVANPAVGVEYAFDLPRETFEVFVPKNYSDKREFGIFVFIDSQNEMTMPKEWVSIMEKEKLICLIPQRIGNDQPTPRRLGLTLIGILKAGERYKTDPKRIFTGGYSGGARCSLRLAFLHTDAIAGNISICGADFYEPVPRVNAIDRSNYGVWPVPEDHVAKAVAKGRFVFITGEQDFRRGNILDIYQGGFVKHGFHAKLIDEPKKGHQLCSPKSLSEAIFFLDGKK